MNITLIRDKLGVTTPEIFKNVEGTLLDWAIETFGESGSERKITYYSNYGAQTEVIEESFEAMNKRYQNVIVMINPAGLEPVTWLWIAYAALTVASFVLIRPPKLDNQTEDSNRKQSPNNALDGQTNLARRLQRIPELFGRNKSYPDLINESVFRYSEQLKIQTEVFCIGRGYHELTDFKSGDTLVSSIPEANLEIFEPFETIPDFEKTATSTSVVALDLPAENETFADNDERRFDWVFSYDSLTDIGTITDIGFAEAFKFLQAGDVVELVDTNIGVNDLDGTYTVHSATDNTVNLADAATVDSDWLGALGTPNHDRCRVVLLKLVDVGPFVAPGSDYSKILIDIEAPQGIAKGAYLNLVLTVGFDVKYQQVDSAGTPTGPVYTESLTVSGKSTEAKFFTFEISANIVSGNDYQVTIVRTTDALIDATSTENIKWTRLASSKFIDGTDSVGTTRARLTLTANEQSINIQDRKFNCIATRKCLTYDGSNVVGDLSTGAGLTASDRFADAFLTYFLDPYLANRASALLDIDGLYDIQNDLDSVFNGDHGKFSFTFDSDSASAQEELFTIADAARCFITKSGNYYTITRDQAQPSPARLINRSLKKPNSERKTINYNTTTSKDGVEFTYFDVDADERKTIILPNELPSSDTLYGTPVTQNPAKIQGIGITNRQQAWNRAQYEFRRLIYMRKSVRVELGASIATLPLNSRIEYSDGTLPADIVGRSDGSVKSINGLQITTTEECQFIDNVDHEVIFTTESGGTQGPYLVSPLSHTFGFELNVNPEESPFTRGNNDYQRGTQYVFRAVSEPTNAMMLQSKAPTDSFYYTCELINYSDDYYTADNQAAP